MKLNVIIDENVNPNSHLIVVKFQGDKRDKKFEVFCSFKPHDYGMRKWDTWELILKLDSDEIQMEDGTMKYETILTCDKAKLIEQIGDK